MAASNMPDTALVSEMCEEFFAETEERDVWQTVVFENNGLLFDAEHGVEARRNPLCAAEIVIGVDSSNVARPVYSFADQLANGCDVAGIARVVAPRSIGNDPEALRFRFPDALQHPHGQFGTAENDEDDRCVQAHRGEVSCVRVRRSW